MLTLKEDRRIDSKIAQFNRVILGEKDPTVMRKYVERFIEDIGNINSTVSATNFDGWIGYTVLHFTVFFCEKELFFLLLDKGANFTIKDNDGDTALHSAFKHHLFEDDNDVSILMTHLENSKIENICDKYGFSYFHIACIANNEKLVQRFLANGVSIDQAVLSESSYCPGYTPLHFAVKNCAFEVVEMLLFRGANINAKDSRHVTPLHQLLQKNFHLSNLKTIGTSENSNQMTKEKIKKILGLLLQTYTDVNGEMIIIDDIDLSNLHVACILEDLTVAESIVRKVTNINHCIKMDAHQWQGYTALHFAALSSMEAVKLLMKYGADIEVKDAKGVTALDLCIQRFELEDVYAIISSNHRWRDILLSDGHTKLVDLISAMKTPDELAIFLNNNIHIPKDSSLWPGFSLIHLALVLSANMPELRAIINKNPAILYSQDIHGWSPLHLACRLDKQNVVNLLMEFHSFYNSPPNLVDEDGLSYMHIACAQKDVNFLERLLLSKSNIDAVYRGKSVVSTTILPQTTPLHVAVANDSLEMVKVLIEHGADVNMKDENDMTPIHLSLATSKNKEITNTLLSSSNLKDSVVNGIGLSHLHVAAYHGHGKAIEKLIADGTNIDQKLNKANEFEQLSEYKGFTPLAFAINEWEFDSAALLMKHGADVFSNSLLYETMHSYPLLLIPNTLDDVSLENRLRMDIGLTKLHSACFKRDYDCVKELLDDGADVNAQIYKNSLRWSRFTPLHVLLFSPIDIDGDFEKILELLIHKGADVTLSNGADISETPIHLAHSTFLNKEEGQIMLPYINKLLEAQRDFSINPTNYEGYTHFHIACNLCNITVVEKFLQSSDIDVNQQVDCFAGMPVNAGATPLQLALDIQNIIGKMQRLRTAKLLLTYGADANVTNVHGDTLLHQFVRPIYFDFFEMLVRFGADVNARNLDGKTPLECLINKYGFSVESLKVLLRFGCQYNIFDDLTEAGCIGLTLRTISANAMDDFIPALTENFSHLIKVDDMNRTAIHNIVSVREFEISDVEYAKLIEELTLDGCDIDDQDKAGRSALHLAAKFRNFPAVLGLLMAGADVNTTDSTGKTAFTCDFALCDRRDRNSADDDTEDVDDDESIDDKGCNDEKCEHFKTFETFAVHVKKLQLCGLDVNPLNEILAAEAYRKFPFENVPNEGFFKELEELKHMKIGLYSLTLFDFMSENGAIVDFPSMSEMKQNAVRTVFSQTSYFRIIFMETSGILQLQYRKAVARVQLAEDGKNSLAVLSGFRLPDICSQIILKLLKNSELKNLISAVENYKM